MKKLLAHPLVLIVITIFCGLFFFSLQKTAQKSEVASQNVDAVQTQIDQLSGELQQAQQTLEYESSPLAKEKILRNELLLQRPGEYVIQIPDESLVAPQTTNVEMKTPWQEWGELLF